MCNSIVLKNIKNYLAAFLMPLIVLLAIFIALDIAPFGDNTLAFVDAHNQYLSFFNYYKGIFTGDNSLAYSFEKTLGGNMIGLFAYYLASPWNVIFLLFKSENLPTALDVVIAFKIAFCSLTAMVFFSAKYDNWLKNLIFSFAYAFCSFNIAYCWSVMWLDAVAMLPLVTLGIEKMIQGKSNSLYVISLAIAIITSFYMGYMLCIFSVLYFIYKSLIGKSNKKSIFAFSLSSLMAGGISAFLMVPAILSFSGGKRKAGTEIVREIVNRVYYYLVEKISPFISLDYDGIKKILLAITLVLVIACNAIIIALLVSNKIGEKHKRIIAFAIAAVFLGFYFVIEQFIQGQNDILIKLLIGNVDFDEIFNGHPNIYVGEFVLILSIAYFFNNKINKKNKVYSAIFVGVFLLSFALYIPNLIWHGFTKNACFNFRYSFIFSFILLMLAREEIEFEFNVKSAIKATALCLIIDAIAYFKYPNYLFNGQILIEAVVIVILFAILLLHHKFKSKQFMCAYLVIGIFAVISISTVSLSQEVKEAVKQDDYSKQYEYYFSVIGSIKENDDTFYRIKKDSQWLSENNDPMLFSYNGVSHYSSTEKSSTIEFLKSVGAKTFDNIYATVDGVDNETLDDLLGVKYIISNDEIAINEDSLPIAIVFDDDIKNISLSEDVDNNLSSIFNLVSHSAKNISVSDKNCVYIETESCEYEILCLTIPNEKGWTAKVDGQQTQIKSLFNCLMGIELTEGTHTIELNFIPPGIWLGLIISTVSLSLFIITKKKINVLQNIHIRRK